MIGKGFAKRGVGLMHNRKGVSPLIATILLISFAVALGAVVMNVGKTIGGLDSPTCSALGLEILTVGDKQRICFAEKGEKSYVEFTLQNGAKTIIDDLHVSIIGNDVFNIDKVLTEPLGIAAGRRVRIEYNGAVGNVEQVIIIPVVESDGEFVLCDNSKLIVENIGRC
ncbi:MAG: archaellin/type IV pilin N-terminal domain-containing protein [Candidatus Woesearchaeota archaeon]